MSGLGTAGVSNRKRHCRTLLCYASRSDPKVEWLHLRLTFGRVVGKTTGIRAPIVSAATRNAARYAVAGSVPCPLNTFNGHRTRAVNRGSGG